MWKKIALAVPAALGLAFLALQLVPYGRDHANPPVRQEPAWDSPRTRALAQAACFDCHSNETVWPWYSNLAPLSWRVQEHVDEGRAALNFSEWDLPQDEADEVIEVLREGEMPLSDYLLLHPEARLSPADVEALIAGFAASGLASAEGRGGEGVGRGHEDHDDD